MPRRSELFSLFITLTAFAASANAVAPLISTLSAELGVPAARFGWLLTLQYAAFSLTSFAASAVKERLHLSNRFLVGAGLVIISAVFFAGAAALHSAAALVVWVIPLGIAGSAVETFSSVQISSLSSTGSSKNLSLSQGFYAIGALAAPQLVYVIFGAGLTWNTAFVIIGCFQAAVLAFFLLFPRRRTKAASLAASAAREQAPARSSPGAFASVVLLMVAATVLESLSASWLSFVFERHYELSAKDASLVLVLYWAGALAGRFSIALLPTRWTLWPSLLACTAGVLAASVVLAGAGALPARLAAVGALGLFLGPVWPVIVMTASSTFRSERRSAGLIGAGAAGYASGPLLGSLLLGLGWLPGFYVAGAGLAAVLLACCLAAWRLGRKVPVAVTRTAAR